MAPRRRERGERLAHAVGVGLDEAGVVVEDAELVDDGRALPDLGPGSGDVLEILAASRVGAVRRGDEGQRPSDAVPVIARSVSARNGCQFRLPQ